MDFKVGPMYEHVTVKYHWQRAEDYCRKKGGHLASITSDIDAGAVYSDVDFEAYDANDVDMLSVWLGAKKNESSGKWNWIDGKEWVYEDWNENDNVDDHENCLVTYLLYYTFEETWHTYGCNMTNTFICEYQPDEIVTNSKTHFLPNTLYYHCLKAFYSL